VYILINGAFGVGKSTVARELRSLLPRSAIFDPEWVGLALQRIPGHRLSDFQHIASWRRLTVLGARCLGTVRDAVVIPMAFSDLGYLNEVRSGLMGSGRPVVHFCLVAPLDVVLERLTMRGESETDPGWAWVHRRARECCAAHEAPVFATHVSTHGRAPAVIAAELAANVRRVRSRASISSSLRG